ncbi:DUF3494 domain-containing protein [Fibrella sp. USSR17]
MKKDLRLLLHSMLLLLVLPYTGYGQAPNLGTAASFALFTANGAFTSTGAATVTGDVGTNVGAFTAFPPGTLTGSVRLAGSTQAAQAATDIAAAYADLASLSCGTTIGPTLGNGQVLTPGVYCQPTAAASSLSGTLTLDGPGTYIIKLNSALTTASGSEIRLINGACASDVYIQVTGAVSLGIGSLFNGTILASGAINLASGATLYGRALSTGGAISITDNTVSVYGPTMTVAVTAGACNSATNAYTVSGTVSLTSAMAGTLIITDGTSTTTVIVTAGQPTVAFSLAGLPSGTGAHTVSITGPACSTAGTSYTAPVSCTTAPATSATLGGIAYTDVNKNGSLDGGDMPLAGISVTLSTTAGGVIGTTTTDQTGSYSFTGLSAGTPYSLSFSTPTGYSATAGGKGAVTLTAGQTTTVNPGFSALTPTLTLNLLVDRSIARPGELLTYTLVVTNSGSGVATNVVVRDSTSLGLTYVANSATEPAGTTFTQGIPISTWSIATLGAGQSLSLTFQVKVDNSGILYNSANIPGDTVRVCTSIPVRLCTGDQYILSVPERSASYRWYKNGVLLPGEVTNELMVSEPGSYSLGIDDAGSQCPTFSCCPFIVEADTMPVFQAVALAATCISNSAQNNGQIVLSGFTATHTYQYSLGATFDTANSLSGAPQAIPAGGLLTNALANPATAQAYTVRVTNGNGCYMDVTIILQPTVCDCPTDVCVPFVVRKTKGVGVR